MNDIFTCNKPKQSSNATHERFVEKTTLNKTIYLKLGS